MTLGKDFTVQGLIQTYLRMVPLGSSRDWTAPIIIHLFFLLLHVHFETILWNVSLGLSGLGSEEFQMISERFAQIIPVFTFDSMPVRTTPA